MTPSLSYYQLACPCGTEIRTREKSGVCQHCQRKWEIDVPAKVAK